ncbi:MAG: hypothetical protein KI790_09865 [Cyclobacteriaceae bacterium]|nr:hypothetical protein [Cyclobacteriaceae bacterium HetDA_MAG_MS6]
MMKLSFFTVLVLLLAACTTKSSKESPSQIEGLWNAQWQTLPESFPDVSGDVDYTMQGKISFTGEEVSITAYGYPGCIFSSDTLEHKLGWNITNDSLHLINDESVHGMSYQINSIADSRIELQLMEDIFLTLTR